MKFNKELILRTELPHHIIISFSKVFISRQDCYPIQLKDGAYASIKQPLTLDLIYAHLRGELTLGVYALDPDSIAHWLCFDADTNEEWQALKVLSKTLHTQGIPNYVELSRRGGHVWLFTSPLSGKEIRQFGMQLLAQNDISTHDEQGKQRIELYPKQAKLYTGTGSLVRLPFGIHRKTGKRYSFISSTGEPLAPTIRQQIALLAAPTLVPQTYIDQLLSEAESPPLPSQPKKTYAKLPQHSGETLSERIKSSISVFDFVSRYVELDSLGKGFCPFHEDQHKSFGVHTDHNFWHCYAECGNPPSLPNGGTVIDFWIRMRQSHGQDYSFSETIKGLARILF